MPRRRPPVDIFTFPLPDKYPTWRSITRGNYGYLGSYYTTTAATTTTTATTTATPSARINPARQKNRPH